MVSSHLNSLPPMAELRTHSCFDDNSRLLHLCGAKGSAVKCSGLAHPVILHNLQFNKRNMPLLLLMIAAIVGASVLFRTPVVIALVRPLMERIW